MGRDRLRLLVSSAADRYPVGLLAAALDAEDADMADIADMMMQS